jgi:hypothetical protein
METIFSQPAVWSAFFAAVSATAAWFSYYVNRHNLAAKLMDRLYDLDKMIIASPEVFATFVQLANHPTDDYFAAKRPGTTETEKQKTYYKLKAFAYFYVNLFDEIFAAYGGRPDGDNTWDAWRNYMFARLKHPLVRELVMKGAGLAMEHEVLVQRGASVHGKGFIAFLCSNYHHWSGKCDPSEL